MKYFKKLVSAALILSMLAALVPATVFAAGGRWSVSYDADAYGEGTLSVVLFDAGADATVATEWTDTGSSIRAGATADELFRRGADYYAVVSYTPSESGGSGSSGSGGSGGSSGLTDEQIEAEFDLYYAAVYGKEPPTLGIPDEGAAAEELFSWYEALLEENAFWVWNDDEEEGAWLDKLSVEEIQATVNDWYDPDWDDYDEIARECVGEYVDAYLYYCSGYFSYDIYTKRAIIEEYILHPEYAPPGYTPPSAPGGGSGGDEPSDTDKTWRTVLRRLSGSDLTSGFTVGANFFDACSPLEVTPVYAGLSYDQTTGAQVERYSDVRAYFIADGYTIPALPEREEPDDEEEYELGGDPEELGSDIGTFGNPCGTLPANSPLYVSQGEMLVTTASDACSEIINGIDADPFVDWEKVTVGQSGASVDFTSGRRFVTLTAGEDGLGDDYTVSLTVYLTGGELGSAAVSAQAVCYDFDMTDYSMSYVTRPLKVKPGSYGKTRLVVAGGDLYESKIMFWEKEIGAIRSAVSLTVPSRSLGADAYTSELVFTSLETGEQGPFSEGETVRGDLLLTVGDYRLVGIAHVSEESVTLMTTEAVWGDGGAVTDAGTVPYFTFQAPSASKEMTATASFGEDSPDGFTASATATIPVGGAVAETPTGFSATAENNTVTFSWDPLSFDGLAGFNIYRTDADGRNRVPVATAAKNATGVSVSIDRASWGQSPWYFTLTAAAGERESSDAGPVRVNDPLAPFRGVGSYTLKDASLESGKVTVAEGKTGALALTFTPDADVTADVTSVTATLRYTDISGAAKSTSASLSKAGGFKADLAIPEDAAVLLSVTFTCRIDGTPLTLDTADLGGLLVASVYSLVLPTGDYPLSASFDRAVAKFDRDSYAFSLSEGVLKGEVERDVLAKAKVTFYIGSEPFAMTGALSGLRRDGDSIFVTPSSLPDKLRLTATVDDGASPLSGSAHFKNSPAGEQPVVTAAASADGVSTFYVERTGGSSANIVLSVLPVEGAYSFIPSEGEAILSEDGIPFAPGADLSVSGTIGVKGLGDGFVYLNVVNAEDGTVPSFDVDFEIVKNGRYARTTWYHRTGQLDLLDLEPGDECTLKAVGSPDMGLVGDPVEFRVPERGTGPEGLPTVTFMRSVRIELDVMLYTDELGTGATAYERGITADFDVYYTDRVTGEWTRVDGYVVRSADESLYGKKGFSLNFTSDDVAFPNVDTDKGLKLVFGTEARATGMSQLETMRDYPYEGERINLVSGQTFYTVPCDENGGIEARGLSSQLRITGNGKGSAVWTVSAIEEGDGAVVPAEIKGLRVADTPRVELRTGRAVRGDFVTYVFRNTANGSLLSQSFELPYRNDGAILSHIIDGLTYGEYDMLMYVGTGDAQAQLERQFASGGAVSVPAAVCGAVVRGATLTETDAAVRLDLPAEPVTNAPGIGSITVTPDKDAAVAGERVTFAVHLACVPGGTLTERTLDFNTSGSRFEIDSVSSSLRDGSGRIVTPTVNGTDNLIVPETSSVVSGVVMVSGKVSAAGSGISAHLDAERGAVDHSKYNYCRGVCTVEEFTFSVRATTLRPTAAASGRGAGNRDITATVTSETDPGRTSTQTIPVSRYGYWKAMIEYPTNGQSDTFTVTFRDSDGVVLGEGRTEYVSSGVVPSCVRIAWIFNEKRCELTGFPDETGSFPALDSGILTFDSGFNRTGVCVEIEFDDENEDAYGLTDARRVRDPYLTVTPENGRFSFEYDFFALDKETFDLSIPELGIDEKDVPYATRYYTVYNAANFGAMSIDYDLTPVYEPATRDDGAASFGGTAAQDAEFREFGRAVSAMEEPYVGVGTLECDFAEFNFEGLYLSDIEDAYDPLTDEDVPVILPYSGEAHFSIENEIEIKPVAPSGTAEAIAELSENGGSLSRSFGGGSFIKYAGADEKAYVVLGEDGTSDLVLETTWSMLVDVSAIPDGASSSSPVLRAVRAAATRAGGGDGGIFSVSQSTKETVGGVMLDIATNAPEKLIDSGRLLAKNAEAAKFAKGFAEGFGNVLNVASVGMTAALERKEDKQAESAMEKLIAELKGNLDKSLAYYNSKLTCYKGGAGAVQSSLATIRKMADFDFAEILSNSKISNKALSGFNIAVSATGFIPIPFAGTVIGAINDKNKDLARDNQKFFDDTAAWQAYYKAETAMRKAYGKYDPDACEEQKPDPVDLTDWLKERSKNYSLVDPPAPVKIRSKRIIDPSGTVYEGLLSNPLAGVTVSIEYLEGGEWKLWEEAPDYNDQLPEYVTDASGFYRWDVPDGTWRVKYFKEGYNGNEAVYSDEMDVPPVWLDVNQNMISADPFELTSVLTETGLRLEFSKPVKASDIEAGLITLECDGQTLDGVSFVPLGIEEGLTMAAEAEVPLDRNSSYRVRVNGVATYAGTVCAFFCDVDVTAAPERLVCAAVAASVEDGSRVPYGTKIALTCATEGVRIYYTLDGTCPCDDESTSRVLYTEPITVTGDTTLRVYAVRAGYQDSAVRTYSFLCDAPAPSFTDVSENAYYAAPVAWAVANSITNGTSATKFSPDKGCTRGQVVTFLWRAVGCPEPEGSDNPFRDVDAKDYFYKAVLWAVENGITKGTGANTFSPGQTCTRGQIVTFLWRASGSPSAGSAANPFVDVRSGDYFRDAVLWAVGKGITLGTDKTHFSPKSTCTRGQVVTFLYRAKN
ncbi:MAG: S-layer homology domain-containing protein [Clostridia bacterium]|nr:S-layer homology domain-containing protein [Clostridia bacterium]